MYSETCSDKTFLVNKQ